jgi:hypothetical protein
MILSELIAVSIDHVSSSQRTNSAKPVSIIVNHAVSADRASEPRARNGGGELAKDDFFII